MVIRSSINDYSDDEVKQIISLYKSGLSFTQIGLILRKQKNNIKKILMIHGVWIENRDITKKIFDKNEILQIKELYLNKNLSTQKIANQFNVSKEPIRRILKDLNILRNGYGNGIKIILSEEQKEKIKFLYLNEYKNSEEIGKIIGCSGAFINKYLNTMLYRRNRSNGTSVGMVKRFSGVKYDEYLKNLPKQEKYRRNVINLTNRQPIYLLENYNKRGVSGINGAYHLDHKYSILEGFKNNIEPEVIASLNNLVFIPWEDNVKKRTKCSITKEELIKI